MSLRPILPWCLVALAAAPSSAQVLILRVDRDAAGAGTGASWEDAYPDLVEAMADGWAHVLATGNYVQVWVAEGAYTPAGPGGPRTASFELRPQVALYGGFAGDEPSFAGRDPQAHPTILSGDLLGDDLPGWMNRSDNAYHVVTAPGAGPSSVLDGFTVRGGFANDAAAGHASGGGLRTLDGSPVVVDCSFTGNFASSGAAMLLGGNPWGYAASIRDCRFSDNLAQPYRAGAVYVAGTAAAEIVGCRFDGNRAQGFSAPADGGALFVEAGAALAVLECSFTGNVSSAGTPGMYEGGAICNLSDGLVLERCRFAGNSAETGGGLWNAGDVTIADCTFSANTAVVGGGVMNFFNSATLLGCSFWGNAASDGGGLANSYSPLVRVRDCLLWGNTSPGQPTLKAQVHNLNGAVAEIRWSLVQGLFETIPGEDPPDPADFPGCLDTNPLLADPDGPDGLPGTADDDLSLAAGSPARDAGRNDYRPPGLLEDARLAARFHDDPAAPDTGHGTPPLVDMGACEGGAPHPWSTLGGGTPNGEGRSVLRGSGSLETGAPGALRLTHILPGSYAVLFVALAQGAVPLKGGTLVAWPPALLVIDWLDFTSHEIPWTAWPAAAQGLTVVFQYGLGEPSAWHDISLSNGLRADVP